jgi:hypothetical protein
LTLTALDQIQFHLNLLKTRDTDQWPYMIEVLDVPNITLKRNRTLGLQLFGTPDAESCSSRWSWHAISIHNFSCVRFWFRSKDDLTQFALMMER